MSQLLSDLYNPKKNQNIQSLIENLNDNDFLKLIDDEDEPLDQIDRYYI